MGTLSSSTSRHIERQAGGLGDRLGLVDGQSHEVRCRGRLGAARDHVVDDRSRRDLRTGDRIGPHDELRGDGVVVAVDAAAGRETRVDQQRRRRPPRTGRAARARRPARGDATSGRTVAPLVRFVPGRGSWWIDGARSCLVGRLLGHLQHETRTRRRSPGRSSSRQAARSGARMARRRLGPRDMT